MALSCSKTTTYIIKRNSIKTSITSKHSGFYCLNCLRSLRRENELKSHEKVCKNEDFCRTVIPLEKDNLLELNQYMTSGKKPTIHYLC